MRSKIIGFDIDGTLCREVCFTKEECLKATPRKDVIDKCNELYDTEFIIIYTARRECLAEATLEWLRKAGVKYHAISFKKIPLDLYVDKCARHPDEIK